MSTLAIIGSRSFSDYGLLCQVINTYFRDGSTNTGRPTRFDTVISGGAQGADSLAARWVNEYNESIQSFDNLRQYPIALIELKPDWAKYGKSAGFVRNEAIIKGADYVLCLWDGQSRGSANSLSIAKRLKKPTLIIYF